MTIFTPDLKVQFDSVLREYGCPESSMVPQSSLEDLEIDSLALVEVVLRLEEEFNIEISDDEMESVKRYEDLWNLVFLGVNRGHRLEI